MTFEFNITRPPQAHPQPAWCADLAFEVKLHPSVKDEDNVSYEVDAFALEGQLGNLRVWPYAWQPLHPQAIGKTASTLNVRVPFTRDIVQAIERERAGRGPLKFKLQFAMRYRHVVAAGSAYNDPTTVSKSMTESGSQDWEVHRDPWREFLKQLGWYELEIYEVRTGPAWEDPNLAAAREPLRSAVDLLRFGEDPKAVFGKCFDALETAAKYAAQGDDKKKGFAVLLERTFPKEEDKAGQLDAMIGALNKYAQIGRHGSFPVRHVSHTEALFMVKVTLAIFELLGRPAL
jgi:hypothetical protein